jgi:hypothetical protein
MKPITANHLDHSAQRLYANQDQLHTFMDEADPRDAAFWDTVIQMNLEISGSSFAAQQEFKLEHFLAKNLISSI